MLQQTERYPNDAGLLFVIAPPLFLSSSLPLSFIPHVPRGVVARRGYTLVISTFLLLRHSGFRSATDFMQLSHRFMFESQADPPPPPPKKSLQNRVMLPRDQKAKWTQQLLVCVCVRSG